VSSNPFLGGAIWFLSALEQSPVMDTAARDTLGNNIPKISMARTSTERMDVAISQIGNTLAFVFGGTAVDQLLKRWFAKAQQGAVESTPYRWAVASRSVAIYSTMVSLMWAIPFIRNYVITKRTGSVSFSDVIKSGGAKGPATPEQTAALDASLKYNKKKALTILGIGAAGIVGPAAFGRWAASCGKQAGKEFGRNVFKVIDGSPLTRPFMLEGGHFAKLAGVPSMLFWGIPSYIGWYHASRDPYEKQEVAIRAVNFVACFFGPTPLINKGLHDYFNKTYAGVKDMTFAAVQKALKDGDISKETHQAAEKFLVKKNLGTLGVSIVLLGVTPQLLNIFLTKKRMMKNEQLKRLQGSALPNPRPTPAPIVNVPAGPLPAPPLNITQAAGVPLLSPALSLPNALSTGGSVQEAPTAVQPALVPLAPLSPYVTGFPPVRLGSRAAFG
jgi:hypothetical protein